MSKLIIYFKQAWNLIKQEKLFSSIYIIGTGLSITLVMVLSIIYYIRIANIYPETNRDRLLSVDGGFEKTKAGDNFWGASLSINFIETCLKPVKSAETVTAILRTWKSDENKVQPDGSKEQLPVTVKKIDTQFWKVFPFRFVNGKPFTEADMQSGVRTAVVAESFAKQLLGTTEVTGRQISLNFNAFRICGVVKDASFVMPRTFAQLWIPYTVDSTYKDSFGKGGSLGGMQAYILAPSAGDVEKVRQEVIANINRYNQTLSEVQLDLYGEPDRQWQTIFRTNSNEGTDFNKILWQHALIFLVLLLVPAVSLSGMTDSRMERRMAELGVRRAFGAPVNTLMRQIINENFLFTVLGGIVGLILSYLIILSGRNWIMETGISFPDAMPEGIDTMISPAMLLNLPVFAIALGTCLILNLLSALIPAWRYSRREIIHSLNIK